MLFLFSVSASGELAIGVRRALGRPGMLARGPLSGGAPREILGEVDVADWSPDGTGLAVVHVVGGKWRLEFPIGKTLYESRGYIGDVRFSPRGDLIAIADHPVFGDTPGSVVVVDRTGKARTLSDGWYDLATLCWARSGDEIWFSATTSGNRERLWAVTLSGRRRLVAEVPGGLLVSAISPAGQVLATQGTFRSSIVGIAPGETVERDYSWLDFSNPIALSDDGTILVFEEWGEGGGSSGSVYLRRFDGTPPVHLGEGVALALSPDKQWVLTQSYTEPPQLVLLPTGAGQPKGLTAVGGLHYQQAGAFLPDGKGIVFAATEAGHGRRLYVQSVEGATPRAFTADGAIGTPHAITQTVSPDGRFVAALDSTEHARLFALDGSESRPVPGVEAHEDPLRWSVDGKMLYVWKHEKAVFEVNQVVIATGKRELWKELHPDPAGLLPFNSSLVLTPDGKSYFYDSQRRLNELYLVDGLR